MEMKAIVKIIGMKRISISLKGKIYLSLTRCSDHDQDVMIYHDNSIELMFSMTLILIITSYWFKVIINLTWTLQFDQ